MLKGLDHVNIATTKLEETRRFFVDVLGFTVGPRPEVDIPGYWLAGGGRVLIHLMEVAEGRGQGSIDHFALEISDVQEMRGRLDRFNIPYRSHIEESYAQFQFKDPNGVTVELYWNAG
jgi:catechol 2,3-dioxygenase-like lactoylglutathione lyase family enzyme